MLRTGKKAAAALTLIGDAAKGGVRAVLARTLRTASSDVGEVDAGGGGVRRRSSATCFPLYFRFKGGKGVSTAAGILLALDCAHWPGVLC